MIRRIKLEEFCDMESLELELGSGINLFVGDNGSGKTTILKACRYILGSFFHSFSAEHTPVWASLTPKKSDFREQSSKSGDILEEKPVILSFDIEAGGNTFVEQKLQKNSPQGRALTTTFADYKAYAEELQDSYLDKAGRHKALPLFAYYSTEDIHQKTKVSPTAFEKLKHKPTFGYYNALSDNALLEHWLKRVLVLAEEETGHQEVAIVERALLDVLGEGGADLLQAISIKFSKRDVRFVMTDGRHISKHHLPDGLRRVISIVVDIAFRCAILNQTIYGKDSAYKTCGTVLIDEIELHLHPRLQGYILKGLQRAFPNIQFIVSTHAPMVMSCVEINENNRVYKLEYAPSEEEAYSYAAIAIQTCGLDTSTIIETHLGLSERHEETAKELEQLFALIDDEDYGQARRLLEQLTDKYGNGLPELDKAEAMLSLFEP